MTRVTGHRDLEDEPARDAELAEERFLLSVQRAMQRLLNAKGLRYRDLARRLDVSEARISHLFGDDATNLTIRSVARVFHSLSEQAVLMSLKEFEARLAEARGSTPTSLSAWTISGPPDYFWMDPSAAKVEEVPIPRDSSRPATTRDWALAEAASERRDRAA